MEQGATLHAGLLADSVGGGTKLLAIQQLDTGDFPGKCMHDSARGARIRVGGDRVGRSTGVPREQPGESIGNVFESVDGTDDHWKERLDERSGFVRSSHPSRAHEVWKREPRNPACRRQLHVVTIDPGQFVRIEHGRAVCDLLEIEAASHLGHVHEFLGFARRPAEQCQVVHERLGQVAAIAKLRDARCPVALRKRRMVGSEHERQVRERRRLQTERLVEQDLPRGVRDVIFASNHVRDLHRGVINDDGEVVRRAAVRSQDDRIAYHPGFERDLTAHQVAKRDVLSDGDRKAERGRLSRADPVGRGGWVDRATLPAVLRWLTGSERLAPLAFEIFRGTEAGVRAGGVEQRPRRGRVLADSLGLPVRRMRSADVWPFVPVESQPPQIVKDGPFRLARRSFDIGVLDTEHERAAVTPRQQPVEERRAGVADVEVSGWTRRKAHARDRHETGPSTITATAWAEIASPRPTASTPSLVLALRPTALTSTPRTMATRSRIASI